MRLYRGRQYLWLEEEDFFDVLLTLGSGQQPYCPDCSVQQVVWSGHWLRPSGQITADEVPPTGGATSIGFIPSSGAAAFFGSHVMLTLLSPRSHFPAAELHVVPSGQQWRWSLQHTACRESRRVYLALYYHKMIRKPLLHEFPYSFLYSLLQIHLMNINCTVVSKPFFCELFEFGRFCL